MKETKKRVCLCASQSGIICSTAWQNHWCRMSGDVGIPETRHARGRHRGISIPGMALLQDFTRLLCALYREE